MSSDNVIRPAQFQQREEDLHRAKVYAEYKRESEERVARRVVDMLREEGLLVAVPIPRYDGEGTAP